MTRDGLLNRVQNTLVGWGFSAGIVLITIATSYEKYGSSYQCWLDIGNIDLTIAQIAPMIILVIMIFAVIEAAGNADYYKTLEVYLQYWISINAFQS